MTVRPSDDLDAPVLPIPCGSHNLHPVDPVVIQHFSCGMQALIVACSAEVSCSETKSANPSLGRKPDPIDNVMGAALVAH